MGTTREAYNIFYGLILLLRIFLLTSNIIFLKRENTEPILIIKIIEWRKFIDYLGLSIEANPSRVGKRTYRLSLLGLHQALNMDISIYQGTSWKKFEFGTTKATFVTTNKNIAPDIAPHISSVLIDLSMILQLL